MRGGGGIGHREFWQKVFDDGARGARDRRKWEVMLVPYAVQAPAPHAIRGGRAATECNDMVNCPFIMP